MPNRNGTGPYGEGPATGGRFGRCANRGQRRGQAGQGSRGRGFGYGAWGGNDNVPVSGQQIVQEPAVKTAEIEQQPDIIQQSVAKEQIQTNEQQVQAQKQVPAQEQQIQAQEQEQVQTEADVDEAQNENDQAEQPGQSN